MVKQAARNVYAEVIFGPFPWSDLLQLWGNLYQILMGKKCLLIQEVTVESGSFKLFSSNTIINLIKFMWIRFCAKNIEILTFIQNLWKS